MKNNGALAVPGDLVIGGPFHTNNADFVYVGEPNQIADTATVTVLASGLVGFNNVTDTIGALILHGGEIDTGTGTLVLNGDVTVQASTQVSRIAGKLALGNATRTINAAASPTSPALDITAVISSLRRLSQGRRR